MARQTQISKKSAPVRTDRPSVSNPAEGIDRRTPSGRKTRN